MLATLLSELQHPYKEGIITLFYKLGNLKHGKFKITSPNIIQPK